MKSNSKFIFFIIAAVLLTATSFAQNRPQRPTREPGGSLVVDTTLKPPTRTTGNAAAPKPYKDVITAKAVTTKSFFKIHKIDDKYFFEIPNKMLERDILEVGRISKGANKSTGSISRNTGYANDEISENMIAFSRGPKNKIFLKQKFIVEKSGDSSENGLSRSVRKNNIQPLVASFDIKAFSPDSAGVVIDITDFINGDNDIFFFHKSEKGDKKITTLEADKSYVEGIKGFPINIEIATIKTYKSGEGTATFGLNTSLVLLPEKPMQPRYTDSRIGFFSNRVIDFDNDPTGVDLRGMAARWRLEPKPSDVEKYKRGELVEPQKPIIIYIDPATPKKWVPYLIQGVNDWQVAFEQAGFKNAIMAKEAPLNDSSWSLENALYSALVYKPSNIANASGPHVSDPRSGEIIETHINWYHSVMSLVYKWYFVQCANVDPRARKPVFDDELMGKLIQFVSSHEVGHTLGLMHNFGSSSTVLVENLRNKAWVEANGHTPSIMDYARFNYVAQPGDGIGEKGLFPRIGPYDKWAIQWGYKLYPELKTESEEIEYLNKLVLDSLAKNKFLVYGAQGSMDPRNQSEVLGDNPMLANSYGIKNLKAIMPHLIDWTSEKNEGYENAKEMYNTVFDQYSRYIGHVLRYLQAGYTNYKFDGQPQQEIVPKSKQKEALAFINENLFTTPKWLVGSPEVINVYGVLPSMFTSMQSSILKDVLMGNGVFNKLANEELIYPDAYTTEEYLNDLTKYILGDALKGKPVTDMQRRHFQRIYANTLASKIKTGEMAVFKVSVLAFAYNPNFDKSIDATSIAKAHIKKLVIKLKNAATLATTSDAKNHLLQMRDVLENALSASKNISKGYGE